MANCHRCPWNRRQICAHIDDTCGKFATGVIDNGGKFAAGVVDNGDKFAAGVVDSGGKFATGAVDTSGTSLLANISANFWKNLKQSFWYTYSGAGEKLIHEKNQKQKL